MSVMDNVLVASSRAGENPVAAIFQRSRLRREDARSIANARAVLELVGLRGLQERLARDLSVGQQKLLALARTLSSGSRVILLDEPMAGVHHATVQVLQSILKQLTAAGHVVVTIEHDLDLVAKHADRVIVMRDGRIAADGPAAVALRAAAGWKSGNGCRGPASGIRS